MTIAAALAVACVGGIFAVWLIYPLVVAALAARHRMPQCPSRNADPVAESPTISVVIAARDNAHAILDRVVDCLRTAPDALLEIVVGLDRRGDACADELNLPPNVRVVAGDEPGGKAATLNAAVRAARGELLVFTDVYQRFESNAIARLTAAFKDEHVGAASGRLELGAAAGRSLVGRYWSYERWLRRCEAVLHSCVGVTGAIWALRRSLWQPLPPNLILDDVYTPMRVVLDGSRVAFIDDARAVDDRPADRSREYQRKVRTLTGVLQLCSWLPQLLLPRRNPIWLQFVFHKLLRLVTPYLLLAAAACGVVMAVLWLQSNPLFLTLPVMAVAAVAITGKTRLVQKARDMASWAMMLQLATVMAAVNAVRRRWDVWGIP